MGTVDENPQEETETPAKKTRKSARISPIDAEKEKAALEKKKKSLPLPPDPFQRGNKVPHLCQLENDLNDTVNLFITNASPLETGLVNPELSQVGFEAIQKYDIFNCRGDRSYILTQCNKTKSGMKRRGADPLLYVVSDEMGQELLVISGRFSIVHFCCGRGVKIYLGGVIIGYISKHMFGVYVIKDSKGHPHYIVTCHPQTTNQLVVEYLHDDEIVADIAKGVWKNLSNMVARELKQRNVYGIQFDNEVHISAENKAVMFGAMVAIFHDKFRQSGNDSPLAPISTNASPSTTKTIKEKSSATTVAK